MRCIKPNNAQAAERFDAALVLHQLRCCGVTEIARVARAGFPTRYAHGEFAQRYATLLGHEAPGATLCAVPWLGQPSNTMHPSSLHRTPHAERRGTATKAASTLCVSLGCSAVILLCHGESASALQQTFWPLQSCRSKRSILP